MAGQCAIEGNVHGNATVEVGPSASITGNVTASTTPVFNQGVIDGDHVSSELDSLEPEISFPELATDLYGWTYPCTEADGAPGLCEAQPLIHETLLLDLDGDPETPEETVELLSSDIESTDNPARLFYLNLVIPEASLVAFFMYEDARDYSFGISINTVSFEGAFMIEPLSTWMHHFPALIKRKSLGITFRADLADKSSGIADNQITGLIYVLGDLALTN